MERAGSSRGGEGEQPKQPLRSWAEGAWARRRPNLVVRNAVRARLEAWFTAHDFLAVETPALQVSPGLEPNLTAFATDLVHPDGTTAPLYLHTSPEFAMKKLLAAGEPRLFQFARVWRNGERAATHHPEFTMLEWYRAGTDYTALMDDCAALLALAGPTLTWQGRTCDTARPPERLSVQQAFVRHCGVDVLAHVGDRGALATAAWRLGVRVGPDDDWDDLFFRLMAEKVEPHLGVGAATLLHDYPVHMAALSRASARDPRVAERVELYACGVELANGFSELVDAAEQRRRFTADKAAREQRLGTSYPVDDDFLAAVACLPDAAGMALGFDRLIMLVTGATRIEDVLFLPVAEPR